MSREYAIDIWDRHTVYDRDWKPPQTADRDDGRAWAAWEGGEEFSAMIEWRTDAISSLSIFPVSADSADGAHPDRITDPDADPILDRFRDVIGQILIQLDITGRVVIAHWMEIDPAGGPAVPRIWAGKPSLAVPKRGVWTIQTGAHTYVEVDTTRAGNVVVMGWWPHPERPWDARSQTKDALVLVEAFQALSKSVVATASNRSAMRPAIVASRRAHGYLYDPTGAGAGPRQSVRELMRQITARIKKPSDASSAVGVVFEVDDINADITTLDLAGDYDARVSALRPLMVEAFARSAPAPPQVILGTENSNHWSADNAYEQAKQVYLAADARFIARLAAAVTSAVIGRPVRTSWAFQGLESEAWRSGLASELDLTYDAPPTENDLRAVLWTRAMAQGMEYQTAEQYVDTIIAVWQGRQAPSGTSPDTDQGRSVIDV